VGGAGDDIIQGSYGNHDVEGIRGNQVLGVQAGLHPASYLNAPGGVIVNLGTGTASGSDGNDTLSGIEIVRGSEFDDVLTADAGEIGRASCRESDAMVGGAGADISKDMNDNDSLQGISVT